MKPKYSRNFLKQFKRLLMWVIGVIAVGILGAVTGYKVNEYLSSGIISMSVNDIIIYRTSENNYPYFRSKVAVTNTYNESKSIILKSVTLFNDTIIYSFPNDFETIEVAANSKVNKKIVFSSKILDKALRIPMEAAAIKIGFNYQILGDDKIERIFLDSNDVAKCNFWQNPFLQSAKDAKDLGLIDMSGEYSLFWHDSTGKEGKFVDSIAMYTSNECKTFINPQAMIEALFEEQVFLPINFDIFMKKYGGIYFAYMESERTKIEFLIRPSSEFDTLGDYGEDDMFGMNLDHDFDSVKEFIHFSFDSLDRNELYEEFQKNSKYFIWLLYENEEEILGIESKLRDVGFLVGLQQDTLLLRFFRFLRLLPVEDKLPFVQESFNEHVEGINGVIEMDGVIIYSMGGVSKDEFYRLNNRIRQITGKKGYGLLINSGPPVRRNKYAPYAIPLFIAMNFSDSTMRVELDSIHISEGRVITVTGHLRDTIQPQND